MRNNSNNRGRGTSGGVVGDEHHLTYLSTETAEVFRVLANFDLLDLFTETGTITGAVFADDSNLLCALRLQALRWDGED